MLKRVFYFADYLAFFTKHLSFKAKDRFYKDFNFVKRKKKFSSFSLYKDIISSSLKYNITPLEFFTLRFYEKTEKERADYVSARALRRYQSLMNPTDKKDILADKIKFLTHYKDFIGRKWSTLKILQENKALAQSFLDDEKGKIVLKNSRGRCGKQIKIVDSKNITADDLLKLMESENYDLLEEFIVQHDDMMKIAPSALNTIRVLSQIHNGEVEIISLCLKLSIAGYVDNLMSGNIIMPVDLETGCVYNTAVYYDITKEEVNVHPRTGINIVGFQVPYWRESIAFIKKVALVIPENKSVGWDIAITNNGVVLIEGNHDWAYACQLAQRKGFRKTILKFMPTLAR
ncbi:MAG: sugar-transfer associated ATP-grasp domain-containing protein [Agriterribacter sp.]